MTIAEPYPTTVPGAAAPPRLEAGDRLSREEFERRYHAMPHCKKAELLKGLVYMPSPVRYDRHGKPHLLVTGWLFVYVASTPGVEAADNSTVRLGPEDEPQPDALLRILPSSGGRSVVDADGYLTGPPELAAEVASSSVSYDLHVKWEVYREQGVREYVVWRVNDRAVDWFVLRGDRYDRLEPGDDGLLRSEFFPGLWLDPEALFTGDAPRLVSVLQSGIASPDHAAFVQSLAANTTHDE